MGHVKGYKLQDMQEAQPSRFSLERVDKARQVDSMKVTVTKAGVDQGTLSISIDPVANRLRGRGSYDIIK